jgi:hypothetical protein
MATRNPRAVVGNNSKKALEPNPITDLVLELASLRAQISPLKALEKRHDDIRDTLKELYLKNGQKPFIAPGWMVSFVERPKVAYTVAAQINWHISVVPMATVSANAD